MRRAVRMSLRFSGLVRANSSAVDFPIPDEAPVTSTVLPLRRWVIEDTMLRERGDWDAVLIVVGYEELHKVATKIHR